MPIRPDLRLVPEVTVIKSDVNQGLRKLTLCHEEATPANKWTLVEDARTGRLIDTAQGDKTA
jgi:hypothetical protein